MTPVTTPERLDLNPCLVVPSALPDEWGHEIGRWLYARRGSMREWPASSKRSRWLLDELDDAPSIHLLRLKVEEHARAFGLEPQRSSWNPYAFAAHHHSAQSWYEYAGPYPDARVAFSLTLHTPERLFEGGELEFWSGFQVTPDHMTLAVWNPTYSFRVRTVECWAASVAFGRWSIEGVLS